MTSILRHHFPEITPQQEEQFALLPSLYAEWNDKINVISRKDIENIFVKHILHSLAIAKVIRFRPQTQILDVGTGGGFPGIPLAILFPECSFHLVDSIGKKIKVVENIADSLQLKNVFAQQARAESLTKEYDFIVSRAVTQFSEFVGWVKGRIKFDSFNDLPNGILYLKGGDLEQELERFRSQVQLFSIADFFEDDFFESKKVVYFCNLQTTRPQRTPKRAPQRTSPKKCTPR